MFDLSLVALGVEILLELCSAMLSEKKRWVLYGMVAAGNYNTDTFCSKIYILSQPNYEVVCNPPHMSQFQGKSWT